MNSKQSNKFRRTFENRHSDVMKNAICPTVRVFSSQPKKMTTKNDSRSLPQSFAELGPISDEVAKKTVVVDES